jgi:hypothetical protein
MVFNMSGAYAVVDPDKALAAITAIHDALPESPVDVHTCTPLDQVAPTAFAQLSTEQLREFFLDFIALSIEGRVIADIGARGITLSADIPTVERAHEQLHDFIEGCCRVHLTGLLTGLEALSNRDVEQRSNEIYEAAFSLIADAGEDAQ